MAVRPPTLFEIYEVIEQSKIFDPDYYLRTNPDVAQQNLDPLVHFADCGAAEGRKPNFYFDSNWYAKQNADVPSGGVQPLLHYLACGDAEGRPSSLIFNTAWYRKTYAVPAEEIALSHYLRNRKSRQFRPIPDFDPEYYANVASDVVAAEVDLFEHFIRYGYREGRNPSAEFKVQYYADRYLNGDLTRNPFLHYLVFKDMPGIYGRLPDRETTVSREVKRFSKPSPDFEEFRPLPSSAVRRAKLLTYYLPQFHPIPENDQWWGKGFTEWSYIGRGTPRFAGHYQPRAPRDLGYYSLDMVETIRRQVEMALAANVFGFVFYFYWFNRKRLLEKPVEIFLANRTIEMPFCLMWANENWTRRWDGSENELLISQDYGPENDRALILEFARHFRDHRYIRIKGRPLLMIYRASLIPNASETISRWRELFHALCHEDPIFVMGQTFTDMDPVACGCDGAIEFPPHKVTRNISPINAELEFLDHEFNGWVYRYDEIVAQSLAEPPPDYPLIKTAVPSWVEVNGTLVETTLLGAASVLYEDGMWPIAGLVLATTFLMPMLQMITMTYLLVPLRFDRAPYRSDLVFRLLQHVRPWGMTEVLILGMLVALVKLAHIASVVPGAALWSFGALMLLLAAASAAFDPQEVWSRTRAAQGAGPDGGLPATPGAPTALGRGLATCHSCGLLVKWPAHRHDAICPRCGGHLHARKPNSISRTWAFLVAAMVLYIPANLLPVMNTSSLFGSEKDTIMSGVVYLWTSGSWPLAIIVFIASVAVPMLKILALVFLVVSAQMRSTLSPKQRARIYRVVELVGRWSMLDIYVITILVALVQFQGLATIQAGPAAIAFGSVVVLTMFAAMSFDPRLIWDRIGVATANDDEAERDYGQAS